MKTKSKSKRTGPKKGQSRTWAHPFELRLRVVRLHLEEGYSVRLLAEQFGVSSHSVQRSRAPIKTVPQLLTQRGPLVARQFVRDTF